MWWQNSCQSHWTGLLGIPGAKRLPRTHSERTHAMLLSESRVITSRKILSIEGGEEERLTALTARSYLGLDWGDRWNFPEAGIRRLCQGRYLCDYPEILSTLNEFKFIHCFKGSTSALSGGTEKREQSIGSSFFPFEMS